MIQMVMFDSCARRRRSRTILVHLRAALHKNASENAAQWERDAMRDSSRHDSFPHRRDQKKSRPVGGVLICDVGENYFTWAIIHSTVALTCSSLSEALPPRAGIMPRLPVKPSLACWTRVSRPSAMRWFQ